MSVTDVWDDAEPDGATVDANQIDEMIRKKSRQISERAVDLGAINWPTATAGQTVIFSFLTSKKFYSPYQDDGNSGAALTIDLSLSNIHKLVLTANCTFTLSNPTAGAIYVLALKQDGTGSRLVTWPGTVKWQGGVAPVLTTTLNRTDLVELLYDGSNYFGMMAGLNFNI